MAKHLCRIFSVNKVAVLRPARLLKKRLNYSVESLKTAFLWNTSLVYFWSLGIQNN